MRYLLTNAVTVIRIYLVNYIVNITRIKRPLTHSIENSPGKAAFVSYRSAFYAAPGIAVKL